VQLPKEQFQKLFEALIDAFEDEDSLKELARTVSDRHLDRFTTASGTESKLRELIECAERENWVGKLIATARDLRPTHEGLAQFCQELQTSVEELERHDREAQAKAICQFLAEIENEFNAVRLFHTPQKIVLQDQYIPIEVTLERRYRHEVETTWGYAEGEAEFSRAYAMKGSDEMQEETRRVQVPWQDAKQKHKRIIVLADPGMGKTALLKMEAVLGAQASCLHNSHPGRGKGWVQTGQTNETMTHPQSLPGGDFPASPEPKSTPVRGVGMGNIIFPLFFRLSEFAATDEEIADAIPRLSQRNYPDAAPAVLPLLAEKLKNGTCLLLLDALDEVPKEQRNPLSEKLNRFARNYPCPIIVTSRIVGYGGGFLHNTKEVEIVPFSRKQTEEYIETWFKNATSPQTPLLQGEGLSEDAPLLVGEGSGVRSAKGLIRELRQKPQIRGLTQNPLLLSLVCSLYQEGELTLPARRAEIYKQAVEYMLKEWTRNRKPQTEGRIHAKLRLLEELAYRFSCEYKEIFAADDLYDKIEAYLHSATISSVFKQSDSDTLIAEFTEEDGMIQKLEREGDRYLFLHRTFQEYLTASYLNRQPNGIELAKAHFWDFDWHETIILFTGLADDPPPFLNTLLAERDDIFHTLLLLAGKCLAECPQLDQPQLIDRLYDVWRVKLYREFVEPIVVVVGQIHQRMVMCLLAALHDTDWDVRKQAAAVLGNIGDVRAEDSLLAALHDADRGVRGRAAEALGELGDAWAVEDLLVALHDADRGVRGRAARALGKIGDARAVEDLLVALHDADGDVRGRATAALGLLGDARAVAGLLAALHDPVWWVRRQAAWSLGAIGDARAVVGLLATLHYPNRLVIQAAAEALGKIGTLDVLEKLLHRLDIDIYEDENIFLVVYRLAITFNRLHPPPACLPIYPQSLFLRLLKKGVWEVRILWLLPWDWLNDKLGLEDKLDWLIDKLNL
jgi:hypothetical protein